MKRSSLAFFGLLLTVSAMAQKKPFEIKGHLEKVKSGIVYFTDRSAPVFSRDSALVVDGNFEFKSEIAFRSLVLLTYSPSEGRPKNLTMEYSLKQDRRLLYIDGNKISISGNDLKTSVISGGGKTQQEFDELQKSLQALQDRQLIAQLAYTKARVEKNEEEMNIKDVEFHKISDQIEDAETVFIKNNPDSYVCLDILLRRKNRNKTESIRELFALLTPDLKNTALGKSILESLVKLSPIEMGKPAPDFTQNDVNGNPISLSSLKGKFLLVDFWASWCGPCRAENPNVVKLYNKYKDKGFEILGVSLDEKKDNWLKAIKADNLTWMQVSDLKGWKNVVALQYNIKAVPSNVLLDSNGIIIARNLTGQALEEKLAEIFAKSGQRGRM